MKFCARTASNLLLKKLVKLELHKKYPTARFSKPDMRPWGIRELHLTDPAGVCWHFA
jgi:hypothetical protein